MPDLLGLSKPAEKLIECLSSAIGVVWEPAQIRRRAKAECDALILKTKAEGEARELAWRASHRLSHLELRRQQNIESIIGKAVEQLPETSSAEKPAEDWIVNFYELCRDVSDETLQELWGSILAREIIEPTGCSPRTLQVLRNLRREDAELFSRYCSFFWSVRESREGRPKPLRRQSALGQKALRRMSFRCIKFFPVLRYIRKKDFLYEDELHLQHLGLVKMDHARFVAGHVHMFEGEYFGDCYIFRDPGVHTPKCEFHVDALTDAGGELADICRPSARDDDYLEKVSEAASIYSIEMTKKEA